MYQDYVTFLEHVTGGTPLQFLGQPAVKNDGSQLLYFFLPFLGFIKIKIDLRIHLVAIWLLIYA